MAWLVPSPIRLPKPMVAPASGGRVSSAIWARSSAAFCSSSVRTSSSAIP